MDDEHVVLGDLSITPRTDHVDGHRSHELRMESLPQHRQCRVHDALPAADDRLAETIQEALQHRLREIQGGTCGEGVRGICEVPFDIARIGHSSG